MDMLEEIESLSPPIRGIVEGLLESVRQKWIENAGVFLYRAETNATVAKECTTAGFSDAAGHFASKTIWLLAQAFECLANAERFTKKTEPCAAIQLLDRLERLMKAVVGDGEMKISDERMDELTRLARNASPIASEGYFWCSGCQKNVRGRHRCPGVRRTR